MEPLIAIGALGAVALTVVVLATRYSRWGKLRRAPRVRVADARDGAQVKLIGRLRHVEPPIPAPLSLRPCAYYQVVVRQRKSRGDSSHWKTIIDEQRCVARFLLEDESGTALIETDQLQVKLDQDTQLSSGTFNDASPELEAFLTSRGQQSRGWVFNKTLRYLEGVLEEGEVVVVQGLCHLEPDPDPARAGAGYRDRPLRPRLAASPEVRLLASDRAELCRLD